MVSSKSGEGMDKYLGFLDTGRAQFRASAAVAK